MNELHKLKILLSEQIEWYKKHKILEDKNEIDMSYIYDECPEQFSSLKRGDLLEILEILADE